MPLLAQRPDQRRLLVDDPGLIPDAVEELLRLTSPVQGLARTTTRDVTIRDTTIPAGRRVLLLYGSANRDDELYAAARAPLALVSVGADNDYGHPAPSTVATLQRDGFQVLRTDQLGDIAVLGDHADLRYVTSR